MRKKFEFRPSVDGRLEDRAFQSVGFPAQLGPVTTLGYRGNWVLTSRTYAQVQTSVDRAVKAFSNQVVRALSTTFGPNGRRTYDDFLAAIGAQGGGAGSPGRYGRTMLGRLDQLMYRSESRMPYGLGRFGDTGGVGLSTWTSGTSRSNTLGLSIAEQLDEVLSSGPLTAREARDAIESVRQTALNITGQNAPLASQVPGILPNYVASFGPGGEQQFGLKNS